MTSDLPIFWSFRRCPYAMRARLAIKSAGLRVELREIRLKEKPEAFLIASKSATVPALVHPNGKAIDESLDIMFWALETSGDPENWLSGWHTDKDSTLAFLSELDGRFKSNLDRYKYATRYVNETTEAADIASHHRKEGVVFLEQINSRLKHQPFLNGAHAGLTDFATLPFVRQFRIADSNWFDQQNWPELHLWLQEFLHSERFAAIMHKYSPWQTADEPILF